MIPKIYKDFTIVEKTSRLNLNDLYSYKIQNIKESCIRIKTKLDTIDWIDYWAIRLHEDKLFILTDQVPGNPISLFF